VARRAREHDLGIVGVSREPSLTDRGRRLAAAAPIVLVAASILFVAVTLPAVVGGGPLADDYYNCLRPTEIGYDGFVGESARRLGVVRPARFVEIFTIGSLCQQVPFGVVILVPLAITVFVAFSIRGLLRDVSVPGIWADVGGAIWLLHPVGAESALWPSALHVNLGLAAALWALRWYRRERYVLATVGALVAFLSVEQSVLALPLAAWMVSEGEGRRRSAIVCAAAAGAVTVAYVLWPGTDPRAAMPLTDRLAAIADDPLWYVKFPAAGLGLHSIPLAIGWAFPVSVLLIGAGAWLGIAARPRLATGDPPPGLDRGSLARWALGIAVLLVLVNLPLMAQKGLDPRTFTPTWLLLAVLVPLFATRVWMPRSSWAWGLGGALAAACVLSIALSVWVRSTNAGFTEASAQYIAERTSDGDLVVVCGVERSAVRPAPVGSYALNEFVYDWAAEYALLYHTGRQARFRVAGPLLGTDCPEGADADLVVGFHELLTAAGLPER
jgi:hypothetical protein